ncbi:BLOC-1-related complex subunit 5 [Aethina tumida]|uniref:BLOC-1-related complex subunit 5 n=1 Tax=Aethina tumida TaxID=116153 RepID=UPI00096B3AD5|nr:BLOC-1-related complex subunit 5 [Aethina tumida]
MGSEHSSFSNNPQRQGSLNTDSQGKQMGAIKRQHTIANPGSSQDNLEENGENFRSISPGPSVCSDVDLPYISYTVNRPIGDSPKMPTSKQLIKGKSSNRRQIQSKQSKVKSSHNIVVVRGANNGQNTEKDPDVVRLQGIPMFLPIMRATLSLPAARDPEVLERLDPSPFRNLCLRYQHHLTAAANLVATEQNQITQKVREVDSELNKIVATTVDRQKRYAKYAEKLAKVQELSHQLNKCHMLLNQTLESMETLNNYLDINDRLEPFVWTTG